MSASDITAAEYRALGRLMRHARAEGYTYYVTSAFGRTDWSWSKNGNYAVSAEPLAVGWRVTFEDGRAELWPASVQQLTDVLVALGLLPARFSSAHETVAELEREAGMFSKHWANAVDMLKARRAERDAARAVLAKVRELTTWEDGGQREDVPVDEILDVLNAVTR